MEFELVTPAKTLAKFTAQEVVIPGSEGSFGVRPGHAPMLCSLKPGQVRVRDDDGKEHTYTTGNGFVDVSQSKVTVLTDNASLNAS